MANLTKPTTGVKKRSYLKPRPNRKDNFKVYKPVSTNPQIEAAVHKNGERTIHVDLELVYNLARLGLTIDQVAGYYGMSKAKFGNLCDEFPEVRDFYMQGLSVGIAKMAQRLDKIVDTGADQWALTAAIFRLKTAGSGWTEKKDAGRELDDDSPRIQVFLPENNR
jgi:hypothetical protein